MKLVGLISGGKDSLFNILQCISAGHEVVALANIEPYDKDELDSYMYQTVGHEAITLVAGAIGLPLFRHKTRGKAICKNKTYVGTSKDEVEDLYELLINVKKHVFIEGVSVGAIASDYQRTRVENVCSRLNLKAFAYMWRRDQAELLQEMIDADINAVIIKVACLGLNPNIHLGMSIKDMQPILSDLNTKFGVNICGEGGEYETLTLDCPLFHRAISIKNSEKIITSGNAFAPVGFLAIKNASLVPKKWEKFDPVQFKQARLNLIRSCVKRPYNYVEDCVDEVTQKLFPETTPKPVAPELSFPFDLEEVSLDDSETTLTEYWKSPIDFKPHYTSNQSLVNIFTRFNISYTTGWCSIGNVFNSSLGAALQCIQKQLRRVHFEFHDLVFVNLFVKDMSEMSALNKIYSEYMPEVLPPARVCVESSLPSDTSVIISAVAHKNISKSQQIIHPIFSLERNAMHVQSISHWAPANIGPYSQCIGIGEIYYVAGQIPLVPGTMEILNKPIFHQCKLALRHVKRILQAMKESLTYANVLLATCYVTSEEIASDIHSLWTYITGVNDSVVTAVVVSGLPKRAQLEWEVVACGYKKPSVSEDSSTVDDFSVYMKRCVYEEPFASSVLCKISLQKKSQKKNYKALTPKALDIIMNNSISYMRTSVQHLCTLKLFYKPSDVALSSIVNEVIHSYVDLKVIATAIPVLGFDDPDNYVIINGVCH